jgi:hypothetical protein
MAMQLLCPLPPVAGGGLAGTWEEPMRLSLDLTYLEDDSLPSDDPVPPEEGAETGELAAGGATADSTDDDSAAEGAGPS